MDTIDKGLFGELQDSAGADFVVELLDTFLEDAPKLLAELDSALARADAAGFRRAAHSLKSNSHTFGALALSALARDLELGDLATLGAQAEPKLAALALEYQRSADALRSLCHG